MLQDTDFFTKLEQWSTLGDVLATVEWAESVSPDERYEVNIMWRFRSKKVGEAQFIIEPIIETDKFRLYWINLQFINEWQNKGLYAQIVKTYCPNLLHYNVVECVATPGDKEAEAKLASQGFVWRGTEFVLDFQTV